MDTNSAPPAAAELESSTADSIPTTDGSDLSLEATLIEETLVEEISIDGMCGVY